MSINILASQNPDPKFKLKISATSINYLVTQNQNLKQWEGKLPTYPSEDMQKASCSFQNHLIAIDGKYINEYGKRFGIDKEENTSETSLYSFGSHIFQRWLKQSLASTEWNAIIVLKKFHDLTTQTIADLSTCFTVGVHSCRSDSRTATTKVEHHCDFIVKTRHPLYDSHTWTNNLFCLLVTDVPVKVISEQV